MLTFQGIATVVLARFGNMPRYYFNVTNGQTLSDNEGQELVDDTAAREQAQKMAVNFRRLDRQTDVRHHDVVVISESGAELFRVSIYPAEQTPREG